MNKGFVTLCPIIILFITSGFVFAQPPATRIFYENRTNLTFAVSTYIEVSRRLRDDGFDMCERPEYGVTISDTSGNAIDTVTFKDDISFSFLVPPNGRLIGQNVGRCIQIIQGNPTNPFYPHIEKIDFLSVDVVNLPQ